MLAVNVGEDKIPPAVVDDVAERFGDSEGGDTTEGNDVILPVIPLLSDVREHVPVRAADVVAADDDDDDDDDGDDDVSAPVDDDSVVSDGGVVEAAGIMEGDDNPPPAVVAVDDDDDVVVVVNGAGDVDVCGRGS